MLIGSRHLTRNEAAPTVRLDLMSPISAKITLREEFSANRVIFARTTERSNPIPPPSHHSEPASAAIQCFGDFVFRF
jgi:hypothetical protein